jgi:type V secretory pathway adhesin AidA
MPAYLVEITDTTGMTLKNGHNVMAVFAEDGPDAIAAAGGQNDADGGWAGATATLIAVGTDLSPVVDAQGITRNWTLDVDIKGADTNVHFQYTAIAADSYEDVFDAMEALITAHADITLADNTNPLFTVAEIGDDIGDHTLIVEFKFGGVVMPSFVGAIVHEGIPGAVLTFATNASVEIPAVLGGSRTQ